MIETFDFKWFNELEASGKLPTIDDLKGTVYRDSMETRLNISAYLCREAYINKYGFPLITAEVANEMAEYLSGKTILEVCAGSGYLTKCITDVDKSINIICTDDYSWENGGFGEWKNHFIDIEQLDAFEAISKYGSNVDYILLSWPIYNHPLAYQVLRRCMKLNVPLIYIGEDWGGCTANERFFDLVYDKCKMNKIIPSYIPFNGIHDNIYVITKHEKG